MIYVIWTFVRGLNRITVIAIHQNLSVSQYIASVGYYKFDMNESFRKLLYSAKALCTVNI